MSKHIGMRYSSLTVVSLNRVNRYISSDGKKRRTAYFDCQCDCGEKTVIQESQLRYQKSCGCAKTQANLSRIVDITGIVFGRLTAIERNDDGLWLCSCECGETNSVSFAQLKNGNTRSCGCLSASMWQQYRESLGLDPLQPMSSEDSSQRAKFIPVAKETYKRDDYSCVWCSKTYCRINAHHLDTWSQCPEKRFDKDNLVTLCDECHLKVHNNNYRTPPNLYMTILLKGYCKVVCKPALVNIEREEIFL